MSRIFMNNDELSSVNGGLQDTISLGKKELETLRKNGFLNDKGLVNKSDLKNLEECLQKNGWNGIIVELRDNEKFNNLADEIFIKAV